MTHIKETSESVSPHSGLGGKGLFEIRIWSKIVLDTGVWLWYEEPSELNLSDFPKILINVELHFEKQILGIASTLQYICSTIFKDDHQILLYYISLQHKREIQKLGVFSALSFLPLWFFQGILVV